MTVHRKLKLYHCTVEQSAQAILSGGFTDHEDHENPGEFGVWFAPQPLRMQPGQICPDFGGWVLEVRIAPVILAAHYSETIAELRAEMEEPSAYFLLPASLVNEHGTVTVTETDPYDQRYRIARGESPASVRAHVNWVRWCETQTCPCGSSVKWEQCCGRGWSLVPRRGT
jgi:hypothetical protein